MLARASPFTDCGWWLEQQAIHKDRKFARLMLETGSTCTIYSCIFKQILESEQ